MSWQNTTLEAPREGGNSLLNQGVSNYTILDATVGENQYNGRNEVTLRLAGNGASGKTTLPLEPWASDQKSMDTFIKMFTNGLGNIGIDTEGKTAVAVLGTLPKDIASVTGNVIECNVVHSDRKAKPDGSHLKDDGTAWQDQKVYINRLVKKGDGVSAPVAAAKADSEFDSATPGNDLDDDIPFSHEPF